MPIDFKYVPLSGALSGKSFEDQTEQAINELGIVLDESNATSGEALNTANNALRTANNALNTAETAYTDAHNAAVAAAQAQTTADAARNTADSAASQSAQAYDLAARAESNSGEALNMAQAAQTTAESASADATEALDTAAGARQTAVSALALAEMANGIFTVDETQRDADEAYDGAEKSYLTNVDPDSPNLNFPSALKGPLWFEVSVTDDGFAVIQTCRDENASLVFTRKGTVDDNDPENTLVTWTPWKSANVLKHQKPEDVVIDLDSIIENGRFLVLVGDTGAGNNQPLNAPAPGNAYLTVLDDSNMEYIRQNYELCDSDASFYRWGSISRDAETEELSFSWGGWITSSASLVQANTDEVKEIAEQAKGLFAVDDSIRDANESWHITEKSYLTNPGNRNFPPDLTSAIWFEVLLADNMRAVTQVCRSDSSNHIYTRTAEIDHSDPENPVAVFGTWNSIAAPQIIKSVTTQVNPEGQPEGTYLVIISEATEGEAVNYINLTEMLGAGYKSGNGAINISADYRISLQLDAANSAGLAISADGLQSALAGTATATVAGTAGSAIYAPDNDTTSRNRAATPASVTAQISAALANHPSYLVSATAPASMRTLWIKTPTYAPYVHNGTAWVALTAAYSEDAGI